MKPLKPPAPVTYDENAQKNERVNRSTMCYQFFCKDCGAIFGSCNDIGVKDYTMKRLQSVECEQCGSTNWDNRIIED